MTKANYNYAGLIASTWDRWYSQTQAVQLFKEAGFTEIQLLHGDTHEPTAPEDRSFCALGVKP